MRFPVAALVACLAVCSTAVFSQGSTPAVSVAGFPAKAFRLVVSDVAGSPAEAVARVLSPRLAASLGQPVAVEVRPDAAQAVAHAAPDGYTLLLAGPTLAIDSAVRVPPPADAQKDFAAVSLVATFPYVMIATAKMNLDSVQDVVAIAKASPGRIAYASPGPGSGGHLAGELFKSSTSVHLRHAPVNGAAEVLTELAAGRVQVAFVPIAAAEPLLKARTAKALAVTGRSRVPALPEVPTMTEAGVPGFDLTGWLGVLAPAGTGKSIVERLNADVRKALQVPDASERIAAAVSGEAAASSPEAFRDLVRRDVTGWSRLAREMNIRLE